MKWICELPEEVQREIKADATRILTEAGLDAGELAEALDRVMNEKLVNVVGYDAGELPAEKYGKYIWR